MSGVCMACNCECDSDSGDLTAIGWICSDCTDEEFADSPAMRNLSAKYCPICQRDIVPDNIFEVITGVHDGFLFVHDDIEHSDSDIRALDGGIN